MKIVGVSNFNNESEAETLVAENIKYEPFAKVMVDALNANFCDEFAFKHYVTKPDDYRLWRGMADLVGDPDDSEPSERGQ